MVKSVRAELEIDAPIAEAWAVLSDVNSWKDWSVSLHLEVEPAVGAKGKVLVSKGLDKGFTKLPMTIGEFSESTHKIQWGGSLLFLFGGQHWLQLFEVDGGKTRVEHGEDFSGLIPGLGVLPLAKIEKLYARFNEELKKRVEEGKADE